MRHSKSGNVLRVTRNGRTRLVITFRYGNDQRYRREAPVQNMSAARAEAARLMSLAREGKLDETHRPAAQTFATFVESEPWKSHTATQCRPATIERYEALFRQGIFAAFGRMRLDAIDGAAVRKYQAALAARKVQARGPLGLVRTVLRVAVECGALAAFPTDLPPLPRPGRKLPDAPDAAEVEAMLAHADGWLRLAIALAAFAGLRSGEARALEARDVDLKGGRLLVRRAISAEEVVTPKSGHERIVPLTPELAAILRDAIRGKAPTARVIDPTPSRQAVLHALKSLQSKHGLRDRSYHSLRHSFVSRLVRGGASIEAVRVLAGHSKLDVTQRYVHATGDDLEAAIATLH